MMTMWCIYWWNLEYSIGKKCLIVEVAMHLHNFVINKQHLQFMTTRKELECEEYGDSPPNNRGFLPIPQSDNPLPSFESHHTALLKETVECQMT